MATMTRVQAEALAAYVSRVRTDWRPAGIVAALEKSAPTVDVWDLSRALLNLAADVTVKTPGLLDKPGPHWRKPDGDMPGRRGDHDMACPEHPSQVHPCPMCKAEKLPPSDDLIAELRAVAAQAKAMTPKAKFATPQRPASDLDALRKRIDEEASDE